MIRISRRPILAAGFVATLMLLAGCQTTGGMSGANNSLAASSSGGTESQGQTYSIFYDQGSHLKELIAKGQYEEASGLYAKYKAEFFDKKKEKYAVQLDALATKIDAIYASRLESAYQSLIKVEPSIDPNSWPSAKESLARAKMELESFGPHVALFSTPRRSNPYEALNEKAKANEATWQSLAGSAFGSYALSKNFFDAYPVTIANKDVFWASAFPQTQNSLREAGKEAIFTFADVYRNDIETVPVNESGETGSNPGLPLGSRLANLYVELSLVGVPKQTRLKSVLSAVDDAKKHGLKATDIGGITIAFVEATSQTLLQEGQINFPVAVEVDLPFKTVKTSLDEALGNSGSTFDYVLVLDVSMARSQQRAQKRDLMKSAFLAGYKDTPNPNYETARMAVYEAQNAVASNDRQYCYGNGCIGKAIAGIALAVSLNKRKEVFNTTPMTTQEEVYTDYQFSVSDIDMRKAVTANYYIIDAQAKHYFKSVFDLGEEKSFRVAYNLNEKDRNIDSHLKSYDKEEDLSKYDEASVTVRLSDVLKQYSERKVDPRPIKGLAALREEMLVDKNKALAAYRTKEANQSATSRDDPRFDSVVVILNPKGPLGTGFFIAPDLVLTNYHVIEGAQFVEMEMRNGLETFGKVVKSDVRLDLALVRVQSRGESVQLHSGPIPLGATVEAIGHPKGLKFSITRGVISAIRKRPSPFGIGNKEVLFVQTDTPINPGNSGGPLFLGNKVVAVNNNKFSAKGIEGIGFSVHYTEVEEFLRGDF